MSTAKTVLVVGGLGLGGYFLWKYLTRPTTNVVGTSPSNPSVSRTQKSGGVFDSLAQLLGQSSAGNAFAANPNPTQAQEAAGVLTSLGTFAAGFGSAVSSLYESFGSGGSNSGAPVNAGTSTRTLSSSPTQSGLIGSDIPFGPSPEPMESSGDYYGPALPTGDLFTSGDGDSFFA